MISQKKLDFFDRLAVARFGVNSQRLTFFERLVVAKF